MVDKELVRGMLLTQRQQGTCDACHLGKQKKKKHGKKQDPVTKEPNQVVYADLLFPSKSNGTRYEAILVIMDGYSRFVTVHLLKNKASAVVNKHLKEYVFWVERQAGLLVKKVLTHTVKQVLADKGREFVDEAMEAWYRSRGIEHVQVGPKSSQLNLCERTHQSLVAMTKATMEQAGFPRSLWPEAMRNAVYVKNRVYNKEIQRVTYEMFFGAQPDVHRIRKFGSLAYVHVPVTPGRRKHHNNAKIGYVLGYGENVVGCKVYFPTEPTAKFVSDLRVAEDVMYRDRHDVDIEEDDLSSLHFTTEDAEDQAERASSLADADMTTAVASNVSERNGVQPVELEKDEADPLKEGKEAEEVLAAEVEDEEQVGPRDVGCDRLREVRAIGEDENFGDEEEATLAATRGAISQDDRETRTSIPEREEVVSDAVLAVSAELESVAGTCGSSVAEDELDDTELDDAEIEADSDEEEITVASVFASDENEVDASVSSTSGLEEDKGELKLADLAGVNRVGEGGSGQEVVVDASMMFPPAPAQTRKRTHREETPSEEERVERGTAKPEAKKTRTGLREYQERRRPRYQDDYVTNLTLNNARVLDKNGRPIRASEIKTLRNRREVMRSKWRDSFLMGEMEEIAALKAKDVIMEIPGEEVPADAQPVNTIWVYALKSDHLGYVVRFKARIVALGNYRRPGLDYRETFAPVARMSSFRLLMAIAAELGLVVYGGDINTAYLNAWLAIRQYLRSIDGYPCKVNGHMYVVLKAVYGLHQSGREWNSELNQWFLDQGYQRSLSELCLYYRFEGETIAYVLVYVDDILVATNNEQFKSKLFKGLNDAYGLKDQGLLSQYLGVEVQQTRENTTVSQGKYAREIMEKFGYLEAHAVGNPMEVNVRLAPLDENEATDSSFPHREALGMLMYLASSTRPDLAFVLGQLSRFVANPAAKHVGALKRVLRYLAGTQDYGITYERQHSRMHEVVFEGFSDSDWANDPEQRKSTTGFVFTLAGGAVAWMSRRQSIIALSAAEAEYVAACEATMEAVGGSNILQEILPSCAVKLRIGIDNQAAHVMATKPTYSRHTRHVELRWHFVRDKVQKGAVELHKVKADDNPADAFTKALDKKRLKDLLLLMGIAGVK